MVLRKIKIISFILGVALLALIGIQLYWIQNAYSLRKSELDKNIVAALEKTTAQVEKYKTCFETVSKAKINPQHGIYIIRQKWDKNTEQWAKGHDTIDMFYLYDTSVHRFPDIKFNNPATVEIQMRFQMESMDGVTYFKQPKEYVFNDINSKNFYEKLSGDMPFFSLVDSAYLDSVIHHNLASTPLKGKFFYGVIDENKKKLEYSGSQKFSKQILQSNLKANIFKDKYFSRPYSLAVYYPDSFAFVLGTLWSLLITSALIILIVIYAFWYFIKTMLKQKKLAAMKNDFINNMTHEFKTPLTNIALALETIGDDPHRLNGELNYIMNIIGEENNRLRENVERILQIAVVEKEQLQLEVENIDLHMLIEKVVKAFEIQAEKINGTIKCNLKAENAFITGDETHIINVVYNLVDNALKYTEEKPYIVISTQNKTNGIILSVEDNGIGMSLHTQKKIFDKFYRVQNGDVHNVKGFGLGLCYVKSIVEAHKGYIEVKSEIGKGSRFDIFLPYSFNLKENAVN